MIFGVLLPLIYGRPRTFYLMVARPILRSGVRAIAVLLGATLARLLFPSAAGEHRAAGGRSCCAMRW